MSVLSKCLLLNGAIQSIGFVLSVCFRSEKLTDIFGASTFAVLAIKSFQWGGGMSKRQKINTIINCTYSIRLGSYLFYRILNHKDSRFDNIRDHPSRWLGFWILQFLWVAATSLPVTTTNAVISNRPLCSRDYIGWFIAVVGLLLEAVADYQKSSFKANPDNAGKFITTGVWSLCRHPNYLGDILHWTGMFVASTSVLRGQYWWYSLLSPLMTIWLLTCVSGIPLLEQQGQRRWGNDPDYQRYIASTKILIPFIW